MQKLLSFILLTMTCFIAVILIPQANAEQVQENKNIAPVTSRFDGLGKTSTPLTAETIIDGTHFIATDKNIYVLPNIKTPENFSDLSLQSKTRLHDLLDQHRCTLYQTRTAELGRMNRMGHTIAQLECGKDKIWISGQLVREGLAMVWPSPSNPEMVPDLLKLEQLARSEKLGLWADEKITIQNAESIKDHLNSEQIIEAKIENATLTKNNLYLNFSPDWKTDFTIGISPALQRDFAKRQVALQSLRGKQVRVRGWVRFYNGPFIDLETPDQLEVLGMQDQNASAGTSINEPKKPSMQTISHPVAPTIEKPSITKQEEPKSEQENLVKEIIQKIKTND
ncbi:MAG: hypothetical protein AUJ12_02090 [Alphaproteobacteria bacterium CG1_02_46_17]|nr:MAG: hypothetical protein AUJ12_02090 [Alphaproteobacteria bacterium CG1_02_46_17]